jgi:hypothetical protein
MRSRLLGVAVVVALVAALMGFAAAQAQSRKRLNPVIGLLEQKQPVFGLYAPSAGGRGNRGGGAPAAAAGGGTGAPATPPPAPAPVKPPIDLAKETLAYGSSDFVFNGSMEGGLERGLPAFTEFVKAMQEAAASRRRRSHAIRPRPSRTSAAS